MCGHKKRAEGQKSTTPKENNVKEEVSTKEMCSMMQPQIKMQNELIKTVASLKKKEEDKESDH